MHVCARSCVWVWTYACQCGSQRTAWWSVGPHLPFHVRKSLLLFVVEIARIVTPKLAGFSYLLPSLFRRIDIRNISSASSFAKLLWLWIQSLLLAGLVLGHVPRLLYKPLTFCPLSLLGWQSALVVLEWKQAVCLETNMWCHQGSVDSRRISSHFNFVPLGQ